MRCFALLIAAITCTAGSFAGQQGKRTVLNYSFEPVVNDGKLLMHIKLDFKGGQSDIERLQIPSAWGDAAHLEKGISNLTTSVQRGNVHVSYDLVKDWITPPRRPDHHAIVEPDHFEFNTQNGLVHPRLDSGAAVEVNFDWRKLPARWSLATSFGSGKPLQSFRGTWGEVVNALFAGGDFRISRRNISGRPLTLAIRGRWRLTDDEIGAQIQKIIAIQRTFWKDYNFPYYLVTVSIFARESGSSGGSGFTNAFALFLQPTSSFAYDVQSLLAHEAFHTWNPYRMGALPKSSTGLSWFTEGFTTYYQDLLLLRAGITGFQEYVERTNEKLRKYSFSPDKNLSNQEVIERHRVDRSAGDISYHRGAIAALWLDRTIREATKGKATLDNVMLALRHQARRSNSVLSADRIFQAISRYVDPSAMQQFRSFVESGSNITVPNDALGPCAQMQMQDIPPFELGMEREALMSQRVITGIRPGSNAYEAGLRDGQQVDHVSIYWNDVSRPVKLTIRTEAGGKSIQYYPHGKPSLSIPQFRVECAASVWKSLRLTQNSRKFFVCCREMRTHQIYEQVKSAIGSRSMARWPR